MWAWVEIRSCSPNADALCGLDGVRGERDRALVRTHRTVGVACAAEQLGVDRARRLVEALGPPRCASSSSPAAGASASLTATAPSSVTTGDWFTRSPEV